MPSTGRLIETVRITRDGATYAINVDTSGMTPRVRDQAMDIARRQLEYHINEVCNRHLQNAYQYRGIYDVSDVPCAFPSTPQPEVNVDTVYDTLRAFRYLREKKCKVGLLIKGENANDYDIEDTKEVILRFKVGINEEEILR
jgi:hypothetical protein